ESLIKQVLRAYIFCGACGNNRTNRGGFQFAAARLPWFGHEKVTKPRNRHKYDSSHEKAERDRVIQKSNYFLAIVLLVLPIFVILFLYI
ncbi:hypothetical protein NQZ86_22325, partial (plasmid) [Escherichia coli O1:HNT]|uniref:hypothetical protein n=1 Tax=Escherichia coli TaxID=562 RepID=UPI00214C9BEF